MADAFTDVEGFRDLEELVLVRSAHDDAVGLQRVSRHEVALDSGDSCVGLLDLFGGDVLSLRELEDVLGAIDDLEGSVGEDLADISGVEEPVLVEGLGRLLLVLVVPEERAWPPRADLRIIVSV